MFVKDSINTFILRCGIMPLAFVISIIVSNLGPEIKGQIAITIFVVGLLKLIMTMGFEAAVVYYLRRGKYDFDTLTRNLNLAYPVLFVVWSAILIPSFYFLYAQGLFGEIGFVLVGAAFVIAPFDILLDIQIGIFAGTGEISRGNKVGLAFNALYLIVLLFVVFLFRTDEWAVLFSFTAALALASALGIAMNWSKSRSRRGFEFNAAVIRDLASWGIRSQVGALTRKIASRMDLMMTNFFLTIAYAGVYSVALNWAELVLFVPMILHFVLFPYVSERPREQSIDLTNRVTRLSSLVLLVTGGAICLLFPFMEELLYKPDYSSAIYPLIIIMPGVISMGLFRVLMGSLDGLGKPEYGSYASIVALIGTVVLNYLLIQKMGMIGAALATSVANLLAFAVVAVCYMRLSGARLSDFLLVRRRDLVHAYESVMSVLPRKAGGKG